MSRDTVLVYVREAGGAAFIRDYLKSKKLGKVVFIAEGGARKALKQMGVRTLSPKMTAEGYIRKFSPSLILLSATPGASLEKSFIRSAPQAGIPVFSFVDHYWNPWQRFASPGSAKKWSYVPDKIFAPSPGIKARLISARAPKSKIQVVPVERKTAKRISPTSTGRKRFLKLLGLPSEAKTVLMISEVLFPASKKWNWDQPTEKDFTGMARRLADSVAKLSTPEKPVYLLIKRHPAETRNWAKILGRQRLRSVRILDQVNKTELLSYSDLIFGLNSMLCIEAVDLGRQVFSYHTVKTNRSSWLSSFYPGVRELTLPSHVMRTIKSICTT